MIFRALEQKILCRLSRRLDFGADAGIGRQQTVIGKPRPIAPHRLVKPFPPFRIHRVVDLFDPFNVGAELRLPAQVQSQMDTQTRRFGRGIDQAAERGAARKRKIIALGEIERRHGGGIKAFDGSRYGLGEKTGRVHHFPRPNGHGLIATDPDTDDRLTFAIVAGNSDGALALDTNAQLTVAPNGVVPPEAAAPITLRVRVTDRAGLTATATVTIDVGPAVEASPVIAPEALLLLAPAPPDPLPTTPPAAEANSEDAPETPARESIAMEQPSVASAPALNALDAPAVPVPLFPAFFLVGDVFQDAAEAPDSRAQAPVNAESSASRGKAATPAEDTEEATPRRLTVRTVTPEEEGEDVRINLPVSGPSHSPIAERKFVRELDRMRDEVRNDVVLDKALVGSSVAVTTGLSIGYVVWLVRGGMLLSSLLSSLPAWRMVDPLPVLASLDRSAKQDHGDDDSLEAIIKKRAKRATARIPVVAETYIIII